jgi:hypothetical protein
MNVTSSAKKPKIDATSGSNTVASEQSIGETHETMDLSWPATVAVDRAPDSIDLNSVLPNLAYIHANHFEINRAALPVELENIISNTSRLSVFMTNVIEVWKRLVPRLQTEKNRDGVLDVRVLLSRTAMSGLPMFGDSNSAVNRDFRVAFIRSVQLIHEKSSVPLIGRLIEGFKECQQVQYRTVIELYLELTGKGSLETRINNLLQHLKRRWLLQMILSTQTGSFVDPHIESAYLVAIGDDIGLPEHQGAVVDRLSRSHDATTLSRPKCVLVDAFDSFISTAEIVDTVYDNFRTPLERMAITNLDRDMIDIQADLKRWMTSNDMYRSDYYDEYGNVTRDAVVRILLKTGVLLDATIHPKNAARSIELFSKLFEENECGLLINDEDNSALDSIRIALELPFEELSLKVLSMIPHVPKCNGALSLSGSRSSAAQIFPSQALTVVALVESHYSVNLIVKGPEPIRSLLEEILQIRIRCQELSSPTVLWLNDNHRKKLRTTLVSDLGLYCSHCPICLREHEYCVQSLLPCRDPDCISYFTDKNLGRQASSTIRRQPQVTELMICVTYWAALAGVKAKERSVTSTTSRIGVANALVTKPLAEQLADADFTPFPSRFIPRGLMAERQYSEVLACIDRIPSLDVLTCLVESDAYHTYFEDDVYLQETKYMLDWILNSSRTLLEYVPAESQTPSESTLFTSTSKGMAKHMFRVINPPEKLMSFENAKQGRSSSRANTEFLYHGSATSKWYSIIRNSLVVCSGTFRQVNGAAYGNGIYLTDSFDMAHSYSIKAAAAAVPQLMATPTGLPINWSQHSLGISWCVLVVECVKDFRASQSAHRNIKVATSEDVVICRYLLSG